MALEFVLQLITLKEDFVFKVVVVVLLLHVSCILCIILLSSNWLRLCLLWHTHCDISFKKIYCGVLYVSFILDLLNRHEWLFYLYLTLQSKLQMNSECILGFGGLDTVVSVGPLVCLWMLLVAGQILFYHRCSAFSLWVWLNFPSLVAAGW